MSAQHTPGRLKVADDGSLGSIVSTDGEAVGHLLGTGFRLVLFWRCWTQQKTAPLALQTHKSHKKFVDL